MEHRNTNTDLSALAEGFREIPLDEARARARYNRSTDNGINFLYKFNSIAIAAGTWLYVFQEDYRIGSGLATDLSLFLLTPTIVTHFMHILDKRRWKIKYINGKPYTKR